MILLSEEEKLGGWSKALILWFNKNVILKKAHGKQISFITFQICFIYFLFVKQRSISVTKLLTGYVIRKILPRLNFHPLQSRFRCVTDVFIQCHFYWSEKKKENIWSDKKRRIRCIDPIPPVRSRVSFSFFLFLLSVSHLLLPPFLWKGKRNSSFFSPVPYSKWELRPSPGSVCPSFPSFPSRQTEKQTFLWLSYVIKYTLKWIIYISLICWCSRELHAWAHWPSAQPNNQFIYLFFCTKINSTFTLLSILWSQTGHVKQNFSINLNLPIS